MSISSSVDTGPINWGSKWIFLMGGGPDEEAASSACRFDMFLAQLSLEVLEKKTNLLKPQLENLQVRLRFTLNRAKLSMNL